MRSRFTGIQPVLSRRGHTREHSVLGLMFHCHHFETLNNFILKLGFTSEVQEHNGACAWAEEMGTMWAPAFPCQPFHIWETPWHRISVDPWWWEFGGTQHEYRTSMSCVRLRRWGCWQPWEAHPFHLTQMSFAYLEHTAPMWLSPGLVTRMGVREPWRLSLENWECVRILN